MLEFSGSPQWRQRHCRRPPRARMRSCSCSDLEEHFTTPELQRLNGIRFPSDIPPALVRRIKRRRRRPHRRHGCGGHRHPGPVGHDARCADLTGAEGVAYARRLNTRVANEVIALSGLLPYLRHAAAERAAGRSRRARVRGARRPDGAGARNATSEPPTPDPSRRSRG